MASSTSIPASLSPQQSTCSEGIDTRDLPPFVAPPFGRLIIHALEKLWGEHVTFSHDESLIVNFIHNFNRYL